MGLLDSLNEFLDGDPMRKLEKLKAKSAAYDILLEIEEKKRQLRAKKLQT